MIRGGSSKGLASYLFDEPRVIRVLVVDDDVVVQRVHKTLLEKHGLEIQAAYNGKEAVDHIRNGKIFHLILMDLELPVMGGTEATRILREMGVSCKIVGVTASCSEAEKAAFKKAGLDSIRTKPLDGMAVIDILDELAVELL